MLPQSKSSGEQVRACVRACVCGAQGVHLRSSTMKLCRPRISPTGYDEELDDAPDDMGDKDQSSRDVLSVILESGKVKS